MGYLNMPDKTEGTLDADGWLHSGDIAQIDDKGYVTITGRIKVLEIKLSKSCNLYNFFIFYCILGIINNSRWREHTSCID